MRICFIGDSYVNGTGDDECLGWTGRLCADARQSGRDLTHYNLGIRRNTSADIAARWQREAAARVAPEMDGRLVFSFGVNDCVIEDGQRRIDAVASIANARTILATASAWLPTLMIGPPPTADQELNERVRHLSDGLESLCADLAVPFLSTWDRLMAAGVWIREAEQGDGAHPNRGGYALLAGLIRDSPAWRSWIS